MNSVSIIDYNAGNLSSLKFTIQSLGYKVIILKDPNLPEKISKLIIPGVGNYSNAMTFLKNNGWIQPIKDFVSNKNNYLLGICLGMQVLSDKGFESGETNGIQLINGYVEKLSLKKKHRIPHLGWNNIKILKESKILKNIPNDSDFYFAHSYKFKTQSKKNITATTEDGQNINAIVEKENVIGVQFHPEKSSVYGKILLKNFLEI